MTEALKNKRKLAVIARGYAALKEGTAFFRSQEAVFLAGLCSGSFDVDCLVPLVRPSNPLFQTLLVYDTPISHPGFQVVPLPPYTSVAPSFWERLLTWRRSTRIIWRQIQRSDRILILMPSPIGLITLALAFLLGKRAVVYYGGDWSAHLQATDVAGRSALVYHESARAVRTVLQRLVLRVAPILLVRDASLYRRLRKSRRGVHLATSAANVTTADIHVREDTCQDSQVRVLTVCTLRPAKGIPDILTAIRTLVAEGHDAVWQHAGLVYESYGVEVQRHIIELGLRSRVNLLGYQPADAVMELYRRADVFVLASHTEGFPRVLLEASSQSLPLIATAVGGIPAVLADEREALLVPPRAPRELADAIERVIEDASLRRHLIRNGRAWAHRELERPALANQILQLIE